MAVVKRDCATCVTVLPVLEQLAAGPDSRSTVYVQDDPAFFASVEPRDDTDLSVSWHHEVETVPTLSAWWTGSEQDRTVGWHRAAWEALTGQQGLGPDLPEMRPGCGSLSVDPNLVDELNVRFGGSVLRARRVELADLEDEFEAVFDRGWTDGLPVVPPTEARVLRMLEGTSRGPEEIVAVVPPDLVDVTVEKVAINAVMAGCLPEHLPWVLAAVEAVCNDEFNMHGVLATTMPVGPVIVANGPGAAAVGIHSGGNALGQGHRANLTIGRALQLVVRNVGGGRPGGVDRATHGNPGKLSFCFAEDEGGSPWTSLAGLARAPGRGRRRHRLRRRGSPHHRRPEVAGSRVAGDHLRRVPSGHAPPEAGHGLRRPRGRRSRARPRVRRGRLGPRAHGAGDQRADGPPGRRADRRARAG